MDQESKKIRKLQVTTFATCLVLLVIMSATYANNATINIKQYDGPVKEALYGTNGYESYIKQTVSSATVRLITKDELKGLGCSSSSSSCSGALHLYY